MYLLINEKNVKRFNSQSRDVYLHFPFLTFFHMFLIVMGPLVMTIFLPSGFQTTACFLQFKIFQFTRR
jgi:hypothetical protein